MDVSFLKDLFSGVVYLGTAEGLKSLVMLVISGVLIYLAIKKDYEPALLLPIGFGAILANMPPILGAAFPSVLGDEGFLTVLFKSGIQNVEEEIENWRNQGRLPAIHDSIKRTKALDWLVENATVTVVDEAAEAAEKADETAAEPEADAAEPEATEPADTTEE